MREVVDLTCWERADNYRFFQNFLNPSFSVTTEVECTKGRAPAKDIGQSFFLYHLYATFQVVI